MALVAPDRVVPFLNHWKVGGAGGDRSQGHGAADHHRLAGGLRREDGKGGGVDGEHRGRARGRAVAVGGHDGVIARRPDLHVGEGQGGSRLAADIAAVQLPLVSRAAAGRGAREDDGHSLGHRLADRLEGEDGGRGRRDDGQRGGGAGRRAAAVGGDDGVAAAVGGLRVGQGVGGAGRPGDRRTVLLPLVGGRVGGRGRQRDRLADIDDGALRRGGEAGRPGIGAHDDRVRVRGRLDALGIREFPRDRGDVVGPGRGRSAAQDGIGHVDHARCRQARGRTGRVDQAQSGRQAARELPGAGGALGPGHVERHSGERLADGGAEGLAVLGVKVVAPARESRAPSEAAAATADLRRAPMGEALTTSSRKAATPATGERCRRVISIATGRWTRRKRLSWVRMGFMRSSGFSRTK